MLIMILRAIVFLFLLVLLNDQCYSQEQYVEFHQKRSTLEKALVIATKQMKPAMDFNFRSGGEFRDSVIPLPRKRTSLSGFLKNIPLPLTFRIDNTTEGKIITIEKKKAPAPSSVITPTLFLTITGTIENENGEFIEGANIELKDNSQRTQSNEQGRFQLKNISKGASLLVSYGKVDTLVKAGDGLKPIRVLLKTKVMDGVVVGPTNGYQSVPTGNATASIDVIGQDFIGRYPRQNALDGLENGAPGLLFLHGSAVPNGASALNSSLVRGRSTLFANAAPLIVVDNFPYDGDLSNINPNDILSYTVLKDAAATSIWGARAGNGVIVITMRKARSAVTRLVLNMSIGLQQRPDLFNIHSISSPDFLDYEKYLFSKGYYDANFSDSQNYNPVTPGVAILHAEQQGLLSPAAAAAQLAALGMLDVRNDIGKYFYRSSLNQQYSLQLSGGSGASRYYFSAGLDRNLSSLAATQYYRATIRSQNSFQVARNLQLEAGVNFTESNDRNGGNIQYAYQSPLLNKSIYPYAQLADAQGHALPVDLDYNTSYLQQTHKLGFSNWDFKPLSELNAESNTVKTRDYLLTTGILYTILPSLKLEIRYQFEDQLKNGRDLHSDSSYYTRDLVNSYIQVTPGAQALSYPLPKGNILDMGNQETISHQGRAQLNFTKQWDTLHTLKAITGYEIRSLETTENSNRYYGYDPNGSFVNPAIDYTHSYTQYLTYTPRSIPNPQTVSKLEDHFISFYANGSYSYRSRYNAYGSIRKDEANLFGVRSNEKGVPLWSAGLSWQADREKWYRAKWLPDLKLRATYGHGGNIARQTSASTIAAAFPSGVSGSPYPMLVIQSPPNKDLRWEQVRQLNFGIDFSTKKNTLSGTIEYYRKHSIDLLTPTTADPTLGLVQSPGLPGSYYSNNASISGKGIDLKLETHYALSKFKWTTNLILSYSESKVAQYLNPLALGNFYLNQNVINAVKGRPVFSIYSYKASGLDPQTGAPRGTYNGQASADYNSIYNNTPLDSMKFDGPTQPVYFGSLRNSFSWGPLSCSFMLSFQAGHYYRQPATSQGDLALYNKGYNDMAKRWQNPGDEKKTNTPSFHYPTDGLRDLVYLYSNTLVKKADEIRWEDITIGYDLDKEQKKWLPFEHIRVYGAITGVGLLWTANKDGIDPYYFNVPKERPRYSIGLTVHFSPLNSTR